MTVYLVSPERGRHYCMLPNEGTWKQLKMIRGDVWKCDECGRAFILKPIPWEHDWVPVYWWNWRVRRRMKERWC